MKVKQKHSFPREMGKYGNSDMFKYATNGARNKEELDASVLQTWENLSRVDLDSLITRLPSNDFDEMIRLTEEGKLWQYPIDNEFGLDEEKQVPFEEHVFLDQHLEEFPKHESIRTFMNFVIMGLAKNPHMTVDRKKKIIEYYKGYFDSKRDIYKQAGLDIDDDSKDS